jgi:type II secretory ATPase GspE/PulE/Tfp pilus assembly ATPase PilB-like protein
MEATLSPPSPLHVSLALTGGPTLNVSLGRFDPASARLDIPGAPAVELRYVSYLTFRAPRDAPSRPPTAARRRVHLVGGAVLDAFVAPAASGALGFYAWPTTTTDVAAWFVPNTALHRLEDTARTGDLLVATGTPRAAVDLAAADQRATLGTLLRPIVGAEAIEAVAAQQSTRRMRLGDLLMEAKLVSQQQLDAALEEQKRRRERKIGEILLERRVIDETQLTEVLARKFGMALVDLDRTPPTRAAAVSIPREICERYGALAIHADAQRVVVAIADPLVSELNDVLRFATRGRRLEEVLARPSQLRRHAQAYLQNREVGGAESALERILADLPPEPASPPAPTPAELDDNALIRLANRLVVDAIERAASDIHIESNGGDGAVFVRYRIDGRCATHCELPARCRNNLVARFKILAELDIAERRRPQDGKIRFAHGDHHVELRVATMPTVGGNEDLVMRILTGAIPLPLAKIGLSAPNLDALVRMTQQPNGLILCVGPTGSGKTTTLHSVLRELNTPERKIWTAEDPVEIRQAGLRQVQVHSKIGLDFAAALRSFLRADPDVIMVGEMRDQETANIAVEASLTGHLVLSTLHTNGAPETVVRLLDIGLEPFNFADALLGILAQRLVRRLCPTCRKRQLITPTNRDELLARYGDGNERLADRLTTGTTWWSPTGCEACGGTGYRGRIAIHELLSVNEEIKALIHRRAPAVDLRLAAQRNGMETLMQDGIAKVLRGETDLAQVVSVCSR